MKTRFHQTADGQSGLFFTAFGLFIIWQSLQYPLGRAAQMGPGYFPLVVGILLTLVGLAVTATAMAAASEKLPPFEWRAAVAITAAIVASGLLLLTAGLLVAIPVLVVVSSLAVRRRSWPAVIATAVALTFMAWLIFIAGLGLRIPLFWS